MFKVQNKTPHDMKNVETMFSKFFPYAQKRLGFDKPVTVNLVSDEQNAADPLGKTAFYDPQSMSITIFVDNRHPKDMLRSFSHELVHHKQNCDGKFDNVGTVGEDYAQTNQHLRDMEAEAYLVGNGFLVRDYTDGLKTNTQRESIKMNEEAIRKMTRIILEKLDEGGCPPSALPSVELPLEEPPEGLVDDPIIMKEEGEGCCGCPDDAHPGVPHDLFVQQQASGLPLEEGELDSLRDDNYAWSSSGALHAGDKGSSLEPAKDVSRLEETDLIARDKSLREHVSGGKEEKLFNELMKKWCK